jgi:hypothetical protein
VLRISGLFGQTIINAVIPRLRSATICLAKSIPRDSTTGQMHRSTRIRLDYTSGLRCRISCFVALMNSTYSLFGRLSGCGRNRMARFPGLGHTARVECLSSVTLWLGKSWESNKASSVRLPRVPARRRCPLALLCYSIERGPLPQGAALLNEIIRVTHLCALCWPFKRPMCTAMDHRHKSWC